ncbi:MAG: NAD(P)/FAD-dependent oxidoreductase [Acholeplasmataceae bacterium]|jgi:glycerol-3-phosphate dehydrogenase|nr:NAD(P)/FAD-dependent oxidoreductase [Acholeplasmataceae bacterium]
MYDYVIIGSGIIGSLIARELSKYEVSVLILDKENDIASHQTTANSAIIHSGHDPKENTLKARLCVAGNRLYDELEKELNIPLLRTGAFVVAHDEEEEKALEELYKRAVNNGVQSIHFISQKEILEAEPLLSSSITKALSLPSTKVTYPWEVAISAVSNAIKNGAEFKRNSHVVSIDKINGTYRIYLENGEPINTRNIINASGVSSDHIASMIEDDFPLKITPRRGEYFVLDRKAKDLFKHVIYPIPSKAGKGVLIVPQVHGNVLLGPTSENIDEKDEASTTLIGMKKIRHDLLSLSNQIPYHMIIRTFAGIRASSTYDDFYIQESKINKGFYHVAGIDSPGLTAAPAIAKYLIEDIIRINAPLKKNFDPMREKPIVFHKLSDDMKIKLIQEKPKYGNLVCKCEKITEQEIIDAIHGPVGNDTVKGIKKRARAGSGLCQGGYCEGQVIKIIARETNQPLSHINYYQKDTPILIKETKIHDKN